LHQFDFGVNHLETMWEPSKRCGIFEGRLPGASSLS
jgi:hypothetical protein